MRVFIYSLLFFVFLAPAAQGQMLQQKLKTSSLDSQFVYLNLYSKSQSADFKIIHRANLETIRQNVRDSLSTYRKKIADLSSSNSSSAGNIKGLQDSVNTLTTQLEAEQKKTDSISFLGIDFSKGSYHTMVWAIIIALGAAFFGTLVAFRKAKVDTDDSKKTIDELQDELQTLRKKSMEREQHLKRQLLDEQLKRNS